MRSLSNRTSQQEAVYRNLSCGSATNYWSSTENNNNNAWRQNFSSGSQNNNNKNNNYRVRCVRS
ncbi:MAG: DUF1566 domain-containing protein [Bdellovibrionales bacterium]|nr:DUF1566 domain-containing protein [Bdellovibrionales bacterium]